MHAKILSNLEKDLGVLIQLRVDTRKAEATACWETPIYDNYSDSDNGAEPLKGDHQDLIISLTPQGHFYIGRAWSPLNYAIPVQEQWIY